MTRRPVTRRPVTRYPATRYPATAPTSAAGIVTRLLAAVVDLAVVLLGLGVLVLVVAGARFLWSPATFRWPAPPSEFSLAVGGLIAFGYLAVAWSGTGRTYGAAVLGVRVVARDGNPLRWLSAGLRAALYLVFPLGLLWVAVSASRRSLQDVVVGSTVVHDHPAG